MENSIIVSCEYECPWYLPNGDVLHYHKLVLQNGDKGRLLASERFPNKIAVGQEINYLLDENGRIKRMNL